MYLRDKSMGTRFSDTIPTTLLLLLIPILFKFKLLICSYNCITSAKHIILFTCITYNLNIIFFVNKILLLRLQTAIN